MAIEGNTNEPLSSRRPYLPYQYERPQITWGQATRRLKYNPYAVFLLRLTQQPAQPPQLYTQVPAMLYIAVCELCFSNETVVLHWFHNT
jgi:hypothetical protein